MAGLVAVSLGAALQGASGTATAATPARVVDRTFICRNVGIGFPDAVRYLSVATGPYDPGFDVAPQMSVGNGTQGTAMWGAYVRTGPAGRQNESPTGQVTLPRIAAGRCVSTRLRVRLSSRGLRGGAVSDRKLYRCDVPAKVLVRVRAILKRPTAFRTDPRFPEQEDAKANIKIGYLAVSTLRGRNPIAFASVQDAGGKARLFVARSGCALQ